MLVSKPRHGLLILGSAVVVDEPNLERGLADVQVGAVQQCACRWWCIREAHTNDVIAQALLEACKQQLHVQAQKHNLRCFVEVVAAPTLEAGQRTLLQLAGLGSLKPNICIQGWPRGWRSHPAAARLAAHSIMDVRAMNRCVIACGMVKPTKRSSGESATRLSYLP
jgi:hypothetical protein